jgi:hypothetical protein
MTIQEQLEAIQHLTDAQAMLDSANESAGITPDVYCAARRAFISKFRAELAREHDLDSHVPFPMAPKIP